MEVKTRAHDSMHTTSTSQDPAPPYKDIMAFIFSLLFFNKIQLPVERGSLFQVYYVSQAGAQVLGG